jgi:hypothetical protein
LGGRAMLAAWTAYKPRQFPFKRYPQVPIRIISKKEVAAAYPHIATAAGVCRDGRLRSRCGMR